MSTLAQTATSARDAGMTKEEKFVIFASSLGTVFEWYDFYLYATLAPFFASLFFPPGNDTAALLSAFATYAAGFLVRPFGALLFGRIGDLVGRKYTFLVTILVMGSSTFLVGLLPTFGNIGWMAPFLLVTLRLLQGLALGGEYGGAATYVAEHSRPHDRGYSTSFIQTTATLGFFLALGIILLCRTTFDANAFAAWGWRIPFLVSVLLLVYSVYIRLQLNESPIFKKMKEEGKGSTAPLTDSFLRYPNNKYVLLALLGATAGQGVVWYTGQFYALTFLQSSLKIDWKTSYTLVSIALALTTPLFLVCGWLSDRVGRKKIMMASCLLGALTYVPIYMAMRHFSNPDGLPAADPAQINHPMMVLLLVVQMVYVCMGYGPIAAFLVELFPTRIRYTSMSLPYHLGNGWFGGFLPLIATAVTTSAWAKATFGSGAMFTGLVYPIGVCLMTVVVSGLFIRETKGHKIDTEVHQGRGG
jgi:MFS family permease